jgi:hypothetical protein
MVATAKVPNPAQLSAPAPWSTPLAIAKAIIAAHPALLTLDVAAAALVADAIAAARGLSEFATAISKQGPATPDGGWAKVVELGLVDELPAVGYALSSLTLAAAAPVITEVIRATQADLLLRDQLWYPNPAALGGYYALTPEPPFLWEVAGFPIGSGVRIDRVAYDEVRRSFALQLGNLAPRTLSVYLEFLGDDGRPVEPAAWSSRLPEGVDPRFETGHCKFLALLAPTRRIEGIPMPEADLEPSFDLPPEAMSARLIFAGLAAEPWNSVSAPLGAITSAVLGYAVPALMQSAGVLDRIWYQALYQPGELLDQVLQAGLPLCDAGDLAAAYAWLGANIGTLIYGSELPALQLQLRQVLGSEAFAQGAATILWAPPLLALTTAPKSAFTGSVLGGAGSFSAALAPQLLGELEVQVDPDPDHGAWPTAATSLQVAAGWYDGDAAASASVSGLATSSPQALALAAVPANRAVLVEVTVNDDQGRLVARAEVQAPASMERPRRQRVALRQQSTSLSSSSRWRIARSLAYDQQLGHYWGTTPNTATRHSLDGGSGGHHLAAVIGLDLSADGRTLGYVWQASGQQLPICGSTTPTDAQVYGWQTLSALAEPDSQLEFPTCAFTAQPNLAFASAGCGYLVDPRSGAARLRRFEVGVPFDLKPGALSYGRFNLQPLTDLVIDPRGYAVAISTTENALLSLPLGRGRPESDEAVAAISAGPGLEPGRLGGPVALALAPFDSILVLENLNRRIQALDVFGNPLPYFPDERATLPLVSEDRAPTYLDLAVDFEGYLYVLLYLGSGTEISDYRLDLYAPDGAYLSGTPGVNAARIAVDRWRSVYTLDYSTLLGPGQRTEPGVSVYAPNSLQGDPQ